MADPKLLLDAGAIQRSLTRIAHEIAEANADSADVGLIGIQRGGVHLARRLAKLRGGGWGPDAPAGELGLPLHPGEGAAREHLFPPIVAVVLHGDDRSGQTANGERLLVTVANIEERTEYAVGSR